MQDYQADLYMPCIFLVRRFIYLALKYIDPFVLTYLTSYYLYVGNSDFFKWFICIYHVQYEFLHFY